MHLSITTLAVVLSSLQTVQAKTESGCWSKNGVNKYCVSAVNKMLAHQHRMAKVDLVGLPNSIWEVTVGNCKAQLASKTGGLVPFTAVAGSYSQVLARCDQGWWYWDNGKVGGNFSLRTKRSEGEVDGVVREIPEHEAAKPPSTVDTKQQEDVYEAKEHGGVTPKDDSTSTSDLQRAHVRDLVPRSPKITKFMKTFVTATNLAKAYELWQGSFFAFQEKLTYRIIRQHFRDRVGDMVDRALTNLGSDVLGTEIGQNEGSEVRAMAIELQLSIGLESWNSLFNAMGDGGDAAKQMIQYAIAHTMNSGVAAAVYHVYDHNDVVMSILINGVQPLAGPIPNN